MAERFYHGDAATQPTIVLEDDEARHLSKVRRVEPGERVEIFDGKGFATEAAVVSVKKDRVELLRVGERLPDRFAPVRLTLATAVPKGDRLDWLVEKATELGVARLVPLITERSVVDPRKGKLERVRRTVIEACKQCGRNRLMEIDAPVEWADYLKDSTIASRLVAQPAGLTSASWPTPEGGSSVALAVGPEGGFTVGEVDLARHAGWIAVGLGQPILRIETAGIAGCARLLALSEPTLDRESWDA